MGNDFYSYQVHDGWWDDYSYSGAESRRFTLTAEHGAILLSALATFIGIVGTQFWSIVAFAVHLARSSTGPHDAFHHAQQGITRNNGTPLGVIWETFKLVRAYSGSHEWYSLKGSSPPSVIHRKRRVSPLVAISLLVWALFRMAGVFSFKVAIPSYRSADVLLRRNSPGFYIFNSTNYFDGKSSTRYTVQSALQSLAYVDFCYDPMTEASMCSSLPQRRLEYHQTAAAACAFGNRCKSQTIVMETDWLDSHLHFGINAPPQNRVQLRKQVTCAVLDLKDVTEVYSNSGSSGQLYYLGHTQVRNYTAYATTPKRFDQIGYNVFANSFHAAVPPQDNLWQPIPELKFSDGDTSLVLITFGNITYENKAITDPLFGARSTSDDRPGFLPDDLAGAVACVDRFALQDAPKNLRTPMQSIYQVIKSQEDLHLNEQQRAAALRLLYPSINGEIYNAVFGVGARALRAQRYVMNQASIDLPSEQHIIEMQGWFETTLALLQRNVVDFASKSYTGTFRGIGSRFAEDANFTMFPPGFGDLEPVLEAMANSQKIRNIAGFQSFSVLGVFLVFGLGLGIIILSCVVEVLVKVFYRCRRRRRVGRTIGESDTQRLAAGEGQDVASNEKRSPAGFEAEMPSFRLRQWQLDSIFHLQRLAYQGVGEGAWQRSNHDIPVTSGFIDRRALDYVQQPHATSSQETLQT